MTNILFIFYLLNALFVNQLFAFDYTNEKAIKKSLTFHYDEYDLSPYSKIVSVVKWNSKEGIERFERTAFKGDFYRLSHHYKPQTNSTMCGPASAIIILSAIYELNHKPFPIVEELPIKIGDKQYPLEYRMWNESNFFNETTDKILDRRTISMRKRKSDGKFTGGIDIEEIQKMLKVHGVKSKLVIVNEYNDSKLSEFRNLVKSIVNSEKNFLLLNYDHSYKNLMGGHFSSIVAYDEKSDSVLMLDVASFRGPWIWINLNDIYHSMNTKNYSQTSYRGYLIVDNNF